MDLIWIGLTGGLSLIVSADPELLRVVALSLVVSLSATALASTAGIVSGVALAVGRFPGRDLLTSVVNTGLGLPPVVVGLVVTILLWRSGPLGGLDLLYTPAAMVIAQTIVAAPIVAGLTRGAVEALDRDILPALQVDGAGRLTAGWELVKAARAQIVVAVAAGFGRAISEVGASMMVGGNIAGQTRVLTTAIALENSKGEFAQAIALGMVLLTLSFAVNLVLSAHARLKDMSP
jgi:tungstate transport system permease protein